jgi:hypothetical protein
MPRSVARSNFLGDPPGHGSRSSVRVRQRQLLLGLLRFRSQLTAKAVDRSGEARRNVLNKAYDARARNRLHRRAHYWQLHVAHWSLPRTLIESVYSDILRGDKGGNDVGFLLFPAEKLAAH